MMVDFICKNNRDELCDTSKDQICMQCFFILSLMSCKAKTIFEMIDLSFYSSSDFLCFVPFFRAANGTRISPEIFFRININHSSTFRGGVWIFTIALSERSFFGAIVAPIHFWTDKLEGLKSTS